ncbi:MAG: hypothetical protein HOC41_00405 [Candidatus Marinimicrobia bacterium]|nr:hypothetical protein [Candidatus Neomarinimicrobiota bacterium]MBT4753619.1 hypothetical protein [Candidatus Neomarinimicrobiota bacterium]
MKQYFFLILLNTILVGQIFPTVPSNVFRFTVGKYRSLSAWDLPQQNFDLRGIGRHYFNNIAHNDSVRFSSDFDLYHNGSMMVDSLNTIEEWLINFNTNQGASLPVFEAQNIDTSSQISLKGTYLESKRKSTLGNTFKIDYGMSNDVTLSISVPLLDSYTLDQTVSDYSVGSLSDVDILLNYHTKAKSDFETFMKLNDYKNLRTGLKDTLTFIYDTFYKKSSEYSVLWATHGGNNPINEYLIDSKFFSSEMEKDTVNLSDLVNYYYPPQKSGSGVDDVLVSATILVKGNPAWSTEGKANALYARLFLSIPYGKTLASFKEIGTKQFKDTKIGAGVSRWGFGLSGTSGFKDKLNGMIYFHSLFKFSSPEILNTPIGLFSGGHTHPDSIVNQVGDIYKFDEGLWFSLNVGGDIEGVQDRLRIRSEFLYTQKGDDRFISKDPDWDQWMNSHVGYSSAIKSFDIRAEIWVLNSVSYNRIGPISFDVHAGIRNSIFSDNTFAGWMMYGGITTYYQRW